MHQLKKGHILTSVNGRNVLSVKVFTKIMELVDDDVQDLTEIFTYYRVKATYKSNDEKHKLTWAVNAQGAHFVKSSLCAQEVHTMMVQTMNHFEGEKKMGAPPKNEVERAVETLLRKLQQGK